MCGHGRIIGHSWAPDWEGYYARKAARQMRDANVRERGELRKRGKRAAKNAKRPIGTPQRKAR